LVIRLKVRICWCAYETEARNRYLYLRRCLNSLFDRREHLPGGLLAHFHQIIHLLKIQAVCVYSVTNHLRIRDCKAL